MRNNNSQISFGELLVRARLEKALTRAELSRQTGIAVNSLLRYEKAGLEPDGQFPTAPNLAKLCFHLGIAADEALWGCLTREDFNQFGHENSAEEYQSPAHKHLSQQYFYLVKENGALRDALRFLVSDHGDTSGEAELIRSKIKSEANELFRVYDKFQQRMMALGLISPIQEYGYGASTDDDFHAIYDRSNASLTREQSELLRSTTSRHAKKQLLEALEHFEESHPSNEHKEGPDQSPNSPGPSENK